MTTLKSPNRSKTIIFNLVFCFIVAMFVQVPVFAQTDQDAAEDLVVEEVMVTGIRRSLDFAADIKREANSVVDAITAQDIGLFSDNNIGEALARIPGVLLETEAGEGYRVSIRGLGPRFVRTTVNGRTALSSSGGETGNGDDARGFTFNIMPSEVVSKASVSKSTQAYEIEGGIGGVVDLVTNRPLDFKPKGDDFYISATLRGTHNDLAEDERYRGTLFLNKKVSDGFGFFFAATIDEADRIDNLAESQRLAIFEGDFEAGTLVNGVPLAEDTEIALATFSGVRYQEQPIPRDRDTFVTGLQWRTENFDVNFDWTAGFEDETRDDKRLWYGFGDMIRRFDNRMTSLTIDFGDEDLNRTVPTQGTLTGFTAEGLSGSRVEPLLAGLYRRVPRSSDVNVGGLNVEWTDGQDWTIEGDLGYADQDTERILERLRTRLNRNEALWNDITATYDIATYGYPIARLFDAEGNEIDPLATNHQKFNLLERRIFNENAEDLSFRLDFTKALGERNDGDLMSFFDELRFGFAWNEMQFGREVMGSEYDGPAFDMTTIGGAYGRNILNDVNVPGFVHDFAIPDIDDPAFEDYLENATYFVEQSGWFDVTEENTAFYVQGNFSGEGNVPYRGNVGLRYVETDQTNFGWIGEGEGDDFIPADPDNPQVLTARNYSHYLPSFNIAFDIAEDKVLRFAANKALTRPDPIDMSSRIEFNDLADEGDNRASGGNPNLEPYTTISFDASLEWYPERGGSYAVGLFYKDLESFISSGSSPETVTVVDETGARVERVLDVRRPVNTDGGTITGIELQWHVPFDIFTDGFMQYFGIQGSYTYVDAEMDAVVPDRGTPISLRGTSEESGNLVLYFEREKFGARIAGNYRSDYLFQEASDTDRFDEWTLGRTFVDLNVDYLINENMKIRFTAANLTDERRTRIWYTPGRYFSDERDNGQEYVLEFRWTSD
jgi:TonB-dependent receptor